VHVGLGDLKCCKDGRCSVDALPCDACSTRPKGCVVRDVGRFGIPPPLRLSNLVLQHRHQQLIHVLARPHRHHPSRIDLVEHRDVRVHLVGGGKRRRFQLQDRPLVRLGLGAL